MAKIKNPLTIVQQSGGLQNIKKWNVTVPELSNDVTFIQDDADLLAHKDDPSLCVLIVATSVTEIPGSGYSGISFLYHGNRTLGVRSSTTTYYGALYPQGVSNLDRFTVPISMTSNFYITSTGSLRFFSDYGYTIAPYNFDIIAFW